MVKTLTELLKKIKLSNLDENERVLLKMQIAWLQKDLHKITIEEAEKTLSKIVDELDFYTELNKKA